MSEALFLADSSIWLAARRNRESYLAELLADRVARDEVATCTPVALEVLSASPAAGLDHEWRVLWEQLRWLPSDDAVVQRGLELLRDLARAENGSRPRRPLAFVVAACAEAAGEVTVWHWDDDLGAVCEFAGIPHGPEHEWASGAGLVA
jgi:predicted nucleic acid-binding protein